MRGIVAIGLGLLVVAPMLAGNSFRIALTGDSLITMSCRCTPIRRSSR